MDSILVDHRILQQKENPAFYDTYTTGHINPQRHADAIWREAMALDATTGQCFKEKYHAYNKTMGHTMLHPEERRQFVKTRLNYRKHDLPHAFNPVTDHVVPSFDCRPLPERGHPMESGGRGARHRHSPPVPGMSQTIPEGPPIRTPQDLRSASVPPMFPDRYSKKRGIMHWRSFMERSGKNNINYIKTSNYGNTYHDPWQDKRRRATSTRQLDMLQAPAVLR